jgi:hypothetical protein
MSYRKHIHQFEKLKTILVEMEDKLKDEDVDERPTLGQLHMLVKEFMGGSEPLLEVVNILVAANDAKTKVTLAPEKSIQGWLQVHDRLMGPATAKVVRKKVDAAGNQFSLDFAWGAPGCDDDDAEEGDLVSVTRTASDGTVLTLEGTIGGKRDD